MGVLLRWQDPERGPIPPGGFVAIFEAAGLIVPFRQWVVAEVSCRLVEWKATGIEQRPLVINISGRQLRDENLGKVIAGPLASRGIEPCQLEFELTESVLMGGGEAALTLMNMRALGVRLSLDDFRAGYSSLACLQRLALDCLKFDGTFIRDVLIDANDSMIKMAIITLAKCLTLPVVAENVQARDQCDFLSLRECGGSKVYQFYLPPTFAKGTGVLASDW